MDSGYIVEKGTPQKIIQNPQEPQTIDFLNKMLQLPIGPGARSRIDLP